MIRALLTDFGGVLVRTFDAAPRRGLETRLGLPPYTLEDLVFSSELSIRAQHGEISYDDFWRQIGLQLDLNHRMTVKQLRDEFFGGDVFDHDLMAFIRSLRPPLKTGLISNAWTNAREFFTRTIPIIDDFDAVVISAEEGVMKPDPRIYRIALERLGVHAEESIFVDDVLANIQGAEALGIHGVHFRSTEQTQRDVRRLIGVAEPRIGASRRA